MALAISMLFVLILALQTAIHAHFQASTVQAKANGYILQTIKQTSGKLDAYINSMNIVSKNIMANSEIGGILQRHVLQPAGGLSYEETAIINEELSKLTIAYDNINSIHIYTPQFTFSYNFASENENFWDILSPSEKAALQKLNGELVLVSFRQAFVDKISNSTANVFSAVRKIKDFQDGLELGYLFINVHKKALFDIIQDTQIGKTGATRIINREGHIVMAEDESLIGAQVDGELLSRLPQSEGYYVSGSDVVVFYMSGESGWGVATRVPVWEITSEYDDLGRMNYFFALLNIISIVLASFFISRWLTRPIEELMGTMERIHEGDIEAKAEVRGSDELGHMARLFNEATTEINTLTEQNYKAELSKTQAELRAIQAQINPHFLYNALDTIYWMLVVNDEIEISEFVISLSEIMRYSIAKGPDVVKLSKELSVLEHYLSIQKVRFTSKLEWKIQMPDALEPYCFPKMMIQPLVENSIYHGLDPQKKVLRIEIRGRIDGDALLVSVKDNGKGIEGATLQKIREGRLEPKNDQHSRVGLDAVTKRVKLLFGESYSVTIDSEIGKGTEVILRLPLIKQNGEPPK
jgi:two-component system sensor histidine kinase YesM